MGQFYINQHGNKSKGSKTATPEPGLAATSPRGAAACHGADDENVGFHCFSCVSPFKNDSVILCVL